MALATVAIWAIRARQIFDPAFEQVVRIPVELTTAYPEGFGRPTVMLDAGHNEVFPGASPAHIDPAAWEHESNLRVVLALRAHLRAPGRYRVLPTHAALGRILDEDINARWRASNARREQDFAFLSIHGNASGTRLRSGTMVIWSSRQREKRRTDPGSQWLAIYLGAALVQAGFDPVGGLPDAMDVPIGQGDDYLTTWPEYGVYMNAAKGIGALDYNHRAAALVETHYVDNPADVAAFQRPERVSQFCLAVERGLLNWFARHKGLLREPAAPEGRWTVQVAARPSRSEAVALRDDLRSKGLAAAIEEHATDEDTWYRVRVGPVDTEANARALRQELRAVGHADQWTVFLPHEPSPGD